MKIFELTWVVECLCCQYAFGKTPIAKTSLLSDWFAIEWAVMSFLLQPNKTLENHLTQFAPSPQSCQPLISTDTPHRTPESIGIPIQIGYPLRLSLRRCSFDACGDCFSLLFVCQFKRTRYMHTAHIRHAPFARPYVWVCRSVVQHTGCATVFTWRAHSHILYMCVYAIV